MFSRKTKKGIPTNTTKLTLRDYQQMRKNKPKNEYGEEDFMSLYGNAPIRSYYGPLEKTKNFDFEDENEDIRDIPIESMGNLTKDQARELAIALSSKNPTKRDLILQKKREEREAARMEYLNTFWDKLKQKQQNKTTGGKLHRRKTRRINKRKKYTSRKRRF
jgi:hypothetical protein